MDHQIRLKKFLKSVIVDEPDKAGPVFFGFKSADIPEEFLSEDLKREGKVVLSIEGKRYRDFNLILKDLMRNRATEHLKEKELENKLWYLLCEVFLFKKRFGKKGELKKRINSFLGEIFLPFRSYLVFLKLSNVKILNSEWIIRDFTIKSLNRADFESLGVKSKILGPSRIADEFVDQTVMVLQETGNNTDLVLERARLKARFNINFLRAYLSQTIHLEEERLLVALSDMALYKDKEGGASGLSWQRRRQPRELILSDHARSLMQVGQAHANVIDQLSLDIRAAFDRCIYWFGKSVEEADFDQKIIFLFIALESLLTTKDDKRKAEAIVYRLVLLHATFNKTIISPSLIYWLYELRSEIVHGASVLQANNSDYSTLKFVLREALEHYVNYIRTNRVTKQVDFIQHLENSEKIKVVHDYFVKQKGRYAKSIIDSLKERRNRSS